MRKYMCYYSDTDSYIGFYLEIIKDCVDRVINEGIPKDLNGIIELWHIRKLVECGCRLHTWTDEECSYLKLSTKDYFCYVADYFNNIDKSLIESEYFSLYWEYRKSFWEIIDTFKLYNIIEPKLIYEIVTRDYNTLHKILRNKNMVEKYKVILRELFMYNTKSACILIDKYVSKRDAVDNEVMHIPSNLTMQDKENIIEGYLESKDANLNYVRLITQVKDLKNNLILSPRIKSKADKLSKKLNKELMSNPRTSLLKQSMLIQFIDDENVEPVSISQNKNDTIYTYSQNFINKCNDIELILNFIYLFDWMDNHCMLNLISKRHEITSIESLFVEYGRDSYPNYWNFNYKNMLAMNQVKAYEKVLVGYNKSLLTILRYFYENYLNVEYGYNGMSINFPIESDTWLNKCRVIYPEIDGVAKQFNMYAEEGEIDEDIIYHSNPLKLENCKSIFINKYYEIRSENEVVLNIVSDLFGHNRIEYENKLYTSVYDLLSKELKVKCSNCDSSLFELLLKNEIVKVNNEGVIFIDNAVMNVLKSLWEYEACSYWHHDVSERKVIDEMYGKGWLVITDNLLTKMEKDYFSFYLDNMKFTNGFAYRNHYAHGSNPKNSDVHNSEHIHAYYTFLRLLIILVLKIEDELLLAQKIFVINNIINIVASDNNK